MSVPPRSNALALASSAFQITTPRMQAVMTSAKKITITPGVIRRRKPPGLDERCRSGIFRLDGGVPRHSERQTNTWAGIYRLIGGDAVNKSVRKTTENGRIPADSRLSAGQRGNLAIAWLSWWISYGLRRIGKSPRT